MTDQSKNFREHLAFFKTRPITRVDPSRLREQTTSIPIRTSKRIQDIDLAPLFDYRIFPAHILTGLTQWADEQRAIQTGDTIVQQACIPPFPWCVKLVFAVRITRLFHEPHQIGFRYETIKGHVETGSSEFTIESTPEGTVRFRIRTWSRPGNLTAKTGGFLFSGPYQRYCTRQALLHVKKQLEKN